MSACPAAIPLTCPLFTVAIAVFDECQIATFVTSFVVLSESVTTAENCVVAPMVGAVPPTETWLGVGAFGDAAIVTCTLPTTF